MPLALAPFTTVSLAPNLGQRPAKELDRASFRASSPENRPKPAERRSRRSDDLNGFENCLNNVAQSHRENEPEHCDADSEISSRVESATESQPEDTASTWTVSADSNAGGSDLAQTSLASTTTAAANADRGFLSLIQPGNSILQNENTTGADATSTETASHANRGGDPVPTASPAIHSKTDADRLASAKLTTLIQQAATASDNEPAELTGTNALSTGIAKAAIQKRPPLRGSIDKSFGKDLQADSAVTHENTVAESDGLKKLGTFTSETASPILRAFDDQKLPTALPQELAAHSKLASNTELNATSPIADSAALANNAESVARSSTESTTPNSPIPSISDQISREVVSRAEIVSREGRTQFSMRLEPPELGTVQVHLSATDHAVSARFIVANESVRQIVESQLSNLRQSLADAGMSLQRFDVSHGGHGNSNGQAYQQPWQSNRTLIEPLRVRPAAPKVAAVGGRRGRIDLIA